MSMSNLLLFKITHIKDKIEFLIVFSWSDWAPAWGKIKCESESGLGTLEFFFFFDV